MSEQPTGQECKFSLSHYEHILAEAGRHGYRIYPFSAWIRANGMLDGSRTILLRHDIDVSLELALEMANFEAEQGISATYFVRLHARYYDFEDPQARRTIEQLRDIADLGLHYERTHYAKLGQDHVAMLSSDREAMSGFVRDDVFGCAAHLPGVHGPFEEATVKSAGLAFEAYAHQFTQARKYLSDSSARWREGCVCRWLGTVDHLTVLIHPVWWMGWPEPADKVIQRLRAGD